MSWLCFQWHHVVWCVTTVTSPFDAARFAHFGGWHGWHDSDKGHVLLYVTRGRRRHDATIDATTQYDDLLLSIECDWGSCTYVGRVFGRIQSDHYHIGQSHCDPRSIASDTRAEQGLLLVSWRSSRSSIRSETVYVGGWSLLRVPLKNFPELATPIADFTQCYREKDRVTFPNRSVRVPDQSPIFQLG